jgi:hypothetical protein
MENMTLQEDSEAVHVRSKKRRTLRMKTIVKMDIMQAQKSQER